MRLFTLTTAALFAGLCFAAAPSVRAAEGDDTVVLFDGSSLDAWRGYNRDGVPDAWTIEDGAIAFTGAKGSTDLMTKERFDNYEFAFEWKIAPGGNSGVIWGIKEIKGKPAYYTGPEYQVLDDGKGNDTVHGAGALYDLYPPVGKESKPAGEWNTGKIVRQGTKVEHWVNGKKVVEVDMGSDEFKSKIANSKFATWEGFGTQPSGHIALQEHGSPVWYRNITVKRLPAE